MTGSSTNSESGSSHGSKSRVLNFKGRSMTMPDCDLLCENIINSDTLDSIRCADCLLPEEIAKSIIEALAKSKSIKVADFKGNNFRVKGAEHLCELMKKTTTLNELYLEWNSLGLYDAGIESIAEGLAMNKSVEILDLSRNQISHSGGKMLSLALKQNKTLKSLDLRWNNIGVAGGRELLSALQENKSLVDLQLDGNNILGETLNAITTAIQRNVDHQTLNKQHQVVVKSYLEEIKTLEEILSSGRKKWENEIAARDSLISTLRKEKEAQNNQIEKNQIEINNLEKLLKLKEVNQIADEEKYQSEKERFNRVYEAQVKSLTDKILKHIKDKEELEEEITKLKSSIRNNELMFNEDLANQRSRWKEEDAFKSKQYEERIGILVTIKDELQSNINRLMFQETETHEKLVAHQKDIERVIAQNQQSANRRDQEHRNEITKLRNEIDQEKRESRNLCVKLEDAEKKYANMLCEMSHLRTVKDSEIALKENEILSLKEMVKNEEEDIKRIRQEELNRSNMIESALQSYIQSARSAKDY